MRIVILIIFFLISSQNLIGQISKSENISDLDIENFIRILELNQYISKKNSSLFIHLNDQIIDEEYIIVQVAINNFKPKEYSFKSTYDGYTIFTYKMKDYEWIDTSVFFVVDSICMRFLVTIRDSEIIRIEKLNLVEKLEENFDTEIELR